MLPIIVKTVITTIDALIAIALIYNLCENNQQNIGTGVAIFTTLNILAIWL